MRPAVFLDRDGVINENRRDYVRSWTEFSFLPHVFPALRRLAASPFAVVVVSNQSAIGRGLVEQTTVEEIHRRMARQIEAQGGRLDGVFYCPHRPEDGCDCRKPRPGLLLAAAAALQLDLERSFLVGDAKSDILAALNAGCQPLLVRTGLGEEQLARFSPHLLARCRIAADLGQAVDWILDGGML
jgi:D-glycero-D-manno-heptose 1,7-bisphosphate phosphatase